MHTIPHYALNLSGKQVQKYSDLGFQEFSILSLNAINNIHRLALIDRDGVINVKPPKHTYIERPRDVAILEKVGLALKHLNEAGIPVVIITNQPGIYKKLYSPLDLLEINSEMHRQLNLQADVKINALIFCPHPALEEGDIVNESKLCTCRKPKAGMLNLAMKLYPCEKSQVFMLGDFFSDYEAAKNAGCNFIFIDEPSDEREANRKKFKDAGVSPLSFPSLFEAVLFLTK